MHLKKALILGGGPAGLTAASELSKSSNIQPIIIEKSNEWGGLSRTINYKGNRIDIGGHRFFSKSDRVMDWWKAQMIPSSDATFIEDTDDVLMICHRLSRIYFKKRFFDYPITVSKKTIFNLGYGNSILIGFSYLKSVLFPIKKERNLEDFFINRFGQRLYRTFFKSYTEKVWGVSCQDINADWGVQRIKELSISKTIAHFFKKNRQNLGSDISQKDVETSLIEYFYYPKYGPGQMWELVAQQLDERNVLLQRNTEIVKMNVNGNKIKSVIIRKDNREALITADYFISTIPVTHLIKSLGNQVPDHIKNIAASLKFRDFITIGVLLDKSSLQSLKDNWIYIQEPYVKVGRIQIFNNWSPYMVKDPENTLWVGLEYFCNEGDELWNMSEDALKKLACEELLALAFINSPSNVLDSVVIKVPKAYPAYFGSYNQFSEIRAYLDQFENLFMIGRNGMHRYNNQDHSMLAAFEAVSKIIKQDKDKRSIWEVNTESVYNES
ncbi:NAD(P)/FAD-dependent oxidoreductase [Rhizosphaericola mali]|uniref:NAD(P)/FAD-dependent oxidoreductase n=1 Tax=Rhizosphaericola mali TaxID=2545455 RepID=A0A5P2G690_9BACT|nr:NAD(P)/FAD-dependent oxidoreductase [Rhizosphaericola mali]QES89280.1 NAD(P)/FAD-dependent oxidoreductase [Rhizosphaericola mali]